LISLELLAQSVDRKAAAAPGADLQQKVDSLKIGVTDLQTIESLFGKPQDLVPGAVWALESTTPKRVTYVLQQQATDKNRTMYDADCGKGLSFSLFSNPWELYAITIQNKDVTIHSVRVGDSLQAVRKKLGGAGEWRTVRDQDFWWLEFEGPGIRAGFARDKNAEQFPIKLQKPEIVTKIEIRNPRVMFE
jgi:hypothetical protein